MPESYFQLSSKEQFKTLELATVNSGRPANLFEKDIWVVWSLSTLFDSPLGTHLVFKGGTALSKAYQAIRRFSEDVDLTCDIRTLAPELVGMVSEGLDPIPPTRSQEKKWSDEIRKELLPAWLREQAHPIIQAGLASVRGATSRVTDTCIFIDYEPIMAASGYAEPTVMLEFGARSTGEPSKVLPVRCDIEGFVEGVAFPSAKPRVMDITRIFWEKATAAHVYCLQGEAGLSLRFSRHFSDLVRLDEAGHLQAALNASSVAEAVAIHKNAFFAEKDAEGNRIDYLQALKSGLSLLPRGNAYAALRTDYERMVQEQLFLDLPEPFELLMAKCEQIEERLKASVSL
jgi:hypothetical protein